MFLNVSQTKDHGKKRCITYDMQLGTSNNYYEESNDKNDDEEMMVGE